MSKKVVFLDVDGVLNSYRNVKAQGGFPFPDTGEEDSAGKQPKHLESNLDPLAIGMIRKLCEEYGAEIVLSSTWRCYVDAVAFGKKYNLPIVDRTNPNVGKPASIKEYLVLHPEIVNYVVIDDDDMHVGSRQVFTDIEEGFIMKDYIRTEKKLAMAEGMGMAVGKD